MLLLMALPLAACGTQATTKPRSATKLTKQADKQKRERGPRPIIAPPPAYGNKVVRSSPDAADSRS